MTVGIVTDSTSDISAAQAEQYGIEVVPLTVELDHKTYYDGRDLTPAEFYARLSATTSSPLTSAPAPGAFLQAYERLARRAESILCVTISRKLSASFNAAQVARDQFREPERVELLDSEAATVAEAAIVLSAADAARAGRTLEQVRSTALDVGARQDLRVGLDTLEYLQRGGRIGRAQAFLGGLLSVRPILTLRDGEVAPAERVRTRRRMIERLYQFGTSFGEPEMLRVAHAAVPDEAEELATRLRAAQPNAPVSIGWIGPVIGSYTGPGALGVAVVRKSAT